MANMAQRAARRPIHTFTLAFEEQEFNEGPIARQIAAAIGTQHHEVVLTEGRFVENLDTALDSLDQPTFDGLNAYYMSHAIRAAGFTVALSGTGGDELFGGYTSYRDLPVLQRWCQRLLAAAGRGGHTGSLAAALSGAGCHQTQGQAARNGSSQPGSFSSLSVGLRALPPGIPA
jgi:asparagine synthetase B (glutamine-hydrolysing)